MKGTEEGWRRMAGLCAPSIVPLSFISCILLQEILVFGMKDLHKKMRRLKIVGNLNLDVNDSRIYGLKLIVEL